MASSSMFCSAHEDFPLGPSDAIESVCDSTTQVSLQNSTLSSIVCKEDTASTPILSPPVSWFEDADIAHHETSSQSCDAAGACLDDDKLQDIHGTNIQPCDEVDACLAGEHQAIQDEQQVESSFDGDHIANSVVDESTSEAAIRNNKISVSGALSLPVELSPPLSVHSELSHKNDQSLVRKVAAETATPPSKGNDSKASARTSTPAQALSVVSVSQLPFWPELSLQLLPAAARELLMASVHRVCYTARWSYAGSRWHRNYNDLNSAAGYFRVSDSSSNVVRSQDELDEEGSDNVQLPPFSSLPWVDRQMVKEWRTYLPEEENLDKAIAGANGLGNIVDKEDWDFERARTLVPTPISQPTWSKLEACRKCRRSFGPTTLRHHCRLCGGSFCQKHSSHSHKLPHLGYHPDVPERVCDGCKRLLLERNITERIAWRLARCRDYDQGRLQPYFEIGIDSVDQIVVRLTHAALTMAKAIPLGAQATVAVETVDVLRKYGLNGIYTIMLRQEFLAAADLLLKALGINRTAWPLSVHELSAAIFYALAQHRAMRGMNPDRENMIHACREEKNTSLPQQLITSHAPMLVLEDGSHVEGTSAGTDLGDRPRHEPVCEILSNDELSSLIFYAPIALNFIYADKEVDMQLLAAQQGWRLVYAYLDQTDLGHAKLHDSPASALFVHDKHKIACLAIRGTTTIHDVITDVRQVPVPFPDLDQASIHSSSHKVDDTGNADEEWTTVYQGLAVAGMAGAALNLYREHIDALLSLSQQGYRIRLTGHSLGGSVAVLLGVLVNRDLLAHSKQAQVESSSEFDAVLRVYSYGTPSCADLPLSEAVEPFVTTVVLHDDVVPRLTPTSCRGLLKHLLHIRETWVKVHFADDLRAFTDRAKSAWAPRWRSGFTLSAPSSVKLKRYCRKHLQFGKSQLRFVAEKLVGDDQSIRSSKSRILNHQCGHDDCSSTKPADQESVNTTSYPEQIPRLVMDILGGMDVKTEGLVVDGEEFFDTDDDLLDASDDESCTTKPHFHEGNELHEEKGGDEDCPEGVMLEELPLPRMFIPGKIVHIYSHMGVYKAAFVPRTFRELRRISMAGNMLSDHKTQSYYDALLEVSNVRRAREKPPHWTAFDEDDTW